MDVWDNAISYFDEHPVQFFIGEYVFFILLTAIIWGIIYWRRCVCCPQCCGMAPLRYATDYDEEINVPLLKTVHSDHVSMPIVSVDRETTLYRAGGGGLTYHPHDDPVRGEIERLTGRSFEDVIDPKNVDSFAMGVGH